MCECTPEVWRFHPDYVGYYQVSTLGEVRSVDREVPRNGGWARLRGTILAPKLDDQGRRRVTLSVDAVHRTRLVHQMVLEAFISPRPLGLVGCHWDDDQEHNHLGNLRWDTAVANEADKARRSVHWQAQKVTCPLEHLLVSPNLVPSQLPYRACLACNRANACLSRARRLGRPFDLVAEADLRYRRIMGVSSDGGQLAAAYQGVAGLPQCLG